MQGYQMYYQNAERISFIIIYICIIAVAIILGLVAMSTMYSEPHYKNVCTDGFYTTTTGYDMNGKIVFVNNYVCTAYEKQCVAGIFYEGEKTCK